MAEQIPYFIIGDAAAIAADRVAVALRGTPGADFEEVREVVFSVEPHLRGEASAEMARYCIAAGAPGGEAVYRFAAAKGFHFLPPGGFADLAPAPKLFFEIFAAIAPTLARVIEPEKPKHQTLAVTQAARALRDTIFETHGRGDEKIGGDTLSPSTPTSTAGVPVILAAPAPDAAIAGLDPSVPGLSIGPGGVAERPPTLAELQAMEPEERRAWAPVFGFPTAEDEMRVTTRAPAPGPAARARVDRPELGPEAVGEVAVFGPTHGLDLVDERPKTIPTAPPRVDAPAPKQGRRRR